jgi:predicted metal-dependent hydrolase
MAETAEPRSVPDLAAPDAAFWVGVAHWQAGKYLDAVEIFEDLWAGEVGARRRFLQGLIHAGMGSYYLSRQDWPSAASKLASAAGLLAGGANDVPGVDGRRLRDGIAAARAALEQGRTVGAGHPVTVPLPRLLRDGALPEDGDGH